MTLKTVFEAMFASLNLEIDDSTSKLFAEFEKTKLPDTAKTVLDEFQSVHSVNFKNSFKKSILDEEDKHLLELKELLGDESFAKVARAKGKTKMEVLKAEIEKQKTALKSDLAKASKNGDASDVLELKQKIADLEAEKEGVKATVAELNLLKEQNSALQNEVKTKDSELTKERYALVFGKRADLAEDFKKGRRLDVISSEFDSDMSAKGFVPNLKDLDAKVKKADGTTSTKTTNDLIASYIDSNAELKVTAPARAATPTPTPIATEPNPDAISKLDKIKELQAKALKVSQS